MDIGIISFFLCHQNKVERPIDAQNEDHHRLPLNWTHAFLMIQYALGLDPLRFLSEIPPAKLEQYVSSEITSD